MFTTVCDVVDIYGAWLVTVNTSNAVLTCLLCSGLFIIDSKGNLRQVTINDMPVGRSVDETLRLVQAFQFTDKHGEGRLL